MKEGIEMLTLSDKLKRINEYYEWNNQKNKLIEEFSELIIAIVKKRPYHEIKSEIADCYNMLEQAIMHYGFSRNEIIEEMNRKCDRTLKLINEDFEI